MAVPKVVSMFAPLSPARCRRDGENGSRQRNIFACSVQLTVECLTEAGQLKERVEIALAISVALLNFRDISSSDQLSQHLTGQHRDKVVEASISAQVAVETCFADLECARLVDALRALRMLAIIFADPRTRKNTPSDRLHDLRALIQLGRHTADEVGIVHDMALRAEARAMSTLNYCEEWA
ncbi:MAG: hypothetical protein K0R27_1466 [Xanthobacteraceae bacterium]|jgi:hypothetical protein|nr:hypothetical protein [Xanthobacteraceae bacterium]